MASRFYFSAAGTVAGVTPSFDASWNYTSEALRRALLAAKSASESLTIGTQIGPWTATAGQTALDRQYISEPLKAQTISGTFKGQVMTREYAGTDNVDQLYVTVKVINSSGTVVATLFAWANATTTLEFVNNVTHRNKRIADGDSLSSYDCADGDRLLIEIGYRNSTAGTTPEASARWGAPTGTSDLPENETQTTAGVGWIEFSADIGRLFTFTPTDGTTLGGAAETAKNSVYTASVSGGTTLAGAAETVKVHVFTAPVSGGVELAGAADTLYEANSSNTYTYSPSGGVSLNGDAATVKVSVYTASVSGGVSLAGTSGVARSYAVAASGGTALAGTAAIARTLVASVSGGVTLGGAAATSEIAVYTATVSGGTTLGGTAALARTYSPAASGGTLLAGAAATSYLSAGATEYPYTATGGFALGGSGNSIQIRLPIGPDYVVQPVLSYYVAPLITYDAPKPKPKPQPKTFIASGAVIVTLGGESHTQMRSNWTADVAPLRFFIGGSAAVSRTYAAPPQVFQPSAIRRRQKQEDALLLAL